MKLELQWEEENLSFTGYAHKLTAYRYHWHENHYEISILLSGTAEFCVDNVIYFMKEDDVMVIDPIKGHASLSFDDNAIMLVTHIPTAAFQKYLKPNKYFSFSGYISNAKTRYSLPYRSIRFYLAQIFKTAQSNPKYLDLCAKGSLDLLMYTLLNEQENIVKNTWINPKEMNYQETVKQISKYIEDNYQEKITLEMLSDFTKYNRTYISTIFKTIFGVNFHEYLSRVRFQNAMMDLARTNKNLTDIAIFNGFPDLKTFNSRFLSTFNQTPQEYRRKISKDVDTNINNSRNFCSFQNPTVKRKLDEYTNRL